MPFRPLRLLILIDDTRGYCGKVVPRMKEMLEQRAFLVDVHRIEDGPVDITPYAGLVIGTPVFGLGIKGVGPTPALTKFIEDLEDLDEKKVALFCVYEIRPGTTFDRMKGLVLEMGAEFVAAHGYWLLRPHAQEHIIPAECMVRIR